MKSPSRCGRMGVEMLKKVERTIKGFHMLSAGDRVLVAVSGGADSIVLLQVLYELQERLQISLAVAHLDHQLRGEESRKDAQFVAQRAKELDLPLVLESLDTPSYIEKYKLSVEEGAREVRYGFLESAARRVKADKIALGHNKNDQVETFLIHLIRGAGVEGLKGMSPVRGKYIRPLIECSGKEVREFARIRELKFREDRTNLESKYLRNKVRLELLPLLNEYRLNILDRIAHTEEILRKATSYLEQVSKAALERATTLEDGARLILNRRRLLKQGEIIKEMIIREAIRRVKGDLRDVRFAHIQAVLEKLEGDGSRSELSLPGKLLFQRRGEQVMFAKSPKRERPRKYEFPLSLEKENVLKEIGWKFSFKLKDANVRALKHSNSLQELIDRDKMEGPLIVRNRREGDRFRPLGMRGSKKLKDFFIDAKVPQWQRDEVPLLCDQNGVIWVVGMRLSEDYKVGSETREVLQIEASKLRLNLIEGGSG